MVSAPLGERNGYLCIYLAENNLSYVTYIRYQAQVFLALRLPAALVVTKAFVTKDILITSFIGSFIGEHYLKRSRREYNYTH